MTFLHPSLLAAGLASIAIPIIIHLLMNRRRKPVMWGAMRFLEEAFRRTRKRLLLEKWLLLAARCLLLALLALAVARPLVGALGGAAGKRRTFFVVIDNSIASQASDGSGAAALSRHIESARQVLATLRPLGAAGGGEGDRVALITLAYPAEGLVLPASPDAGAVASLLDGLEATDARADIPGAMSLIAAALSPDADGNAAAETGAAYIVLLSDFLEGSADLGPAGSGAASLGGAQLPPGVTVLATEPAAEGVGNVSVVGVEPLRAVLVGAGMDESGAAAGEQVRVTLRRSGPGLDAAAATTVRARIAPAEAEVADAAESRAVVRWAPGEENATVALALPPLPRSGGEGAPGTGAGGAAVITVSIDRDGVAGDNTWRRPVEVRESLRVGIVAPTRFGRAGSVEKLDAAAWVRLALSPRAEGAGASGGVEVVNIEPASMDAARLAGLDAVVLPRPDLLAEGSWARVRLFIDGGGLAVVMPPAGATVHLWGDEMIRVLEPGWSLAREPVALAAGTEASRPVVVRAGTQENTGAGLLSLIEGELVELLRPVSVTKALPIAPESGMRPGAAMPGQTLLGLSDGTPLLWAGPVGAGEPGGAPGADPQPSRGAEARGMLVYLGSALDLEWTDLPTKPLMVPLLNELVLQGVGRAKGATWAAAGTRPAVGRRASELVRIGGGEDGARSVRVLDDGVASEPIRRAGVWQGRDERGSRRALIAINPDTAGSRTGAQAAEAVQAWLAGAPVGEGAEPGGARVVWLPRDEGASGRNSVQPALAAVLGTAEQGSPVSLPLLIAVLALCLAELVLGRLASHASLVTASGPRGAAVEAAA